MIVCHCLGLTDRDVREASCPSRQGAPSAAGSACGGCRETVREILRDARDPVAASRTADAPLAPSS